MNRRHFAPVAAPAPASLAGRWLRREPVASGAYLWMDLEQETDGNESAVMATGEWARGTYNGVGGPSHGSLFATGRREGVQIELRVTYFESGAVTRTTLLRLEPGPDGLRGTEDGGDIAFETDPKLPDIPGPPPGQWLEGDWQMLDRDGDCAGPAADKRAFKPALK